MIIKFEDYLLEEVRLEDVLKSDSNYINSFKKYFRLLFKTHL